MENIQNSVWWGSLDCPRKSKGIGWGVVVFLTLGTAAIGAAPMSMKSSSFRAMKSSSFRAFPLGPLRSLKVNIGRANFYSTTTNINVNTTNNLQNSTIGGSSIGNAVLTVNTGTNFSRPSVGTI